MDYNYLAQMILIAIIFFWSGWQFRASRMEKRVIEINERFEQIINDIQANIYQELEFSRMERDGFMRQQEEVVKSLETYNKQYMELKRKENKERKKQQKEDSNEAKSKLDSLKQNKNNGIKK